MSYLPHCKKHNVSWACGNGCPDCTIDTLKAALSELTETVDDALLLDEELAQAWGDLAKGVDKARKVLGEANGNV